MRSGFVTISLASPHSESERSYRPTMSFPVPIDRPGIVAKLFFRQNLISFVEKFFSKSTEFSGYTPNCLGVIEICDLARPIRSHIDPW